MEKSLISVTEQLAIIRLAKKNIKKSMSGLCYVFSAIIKRRLTHDEVAYRDIEKYIPLFTFENANKHSNGIVTDDKDYFWWEIFPYDSTNRLKFLDWMEEDLLK